MRHTPLDLIYITNNPAIAQIAQANGVSRIMVDLETHRKAERQKHINSVKSDHTIEDVRAVAQVLHKSNLLVRINPWHSGSPEEIEAVIAAGAQDIMLPMWKTEAEVDAFLKAVDRRTHTTLLLETREAVQALDAVLEHPFLEEIYIGLNDLHLSYGKTFLFELLADGTVAHLCGKCAARGIPYGFGGIAQIGKGLVPAEHVIMEHYRLGSGCVILSRSFCDAQTLTDPAAMQEIFSRQIHRIRDFEASLSGKTQDDYAANLNTVKKYVYQAVQEVLRHRSEQR